MEGHRSAQGGTTEDEAASLLRRLVLLADDLPGSLDPMTAALTLLAHVHLDVPSERSALYSAYPSSAVIQLAALGTTRPPWSPPEDCRVLGHLVPPGTIVSIPWNDEGESRVACVARLVRAGETVAWLVLDRPASETFTARELQALKDDAHAHLALLDAACHFLWLQIRSDVGDRERIARLVHNGLAQEIVAVGFALDAIRLDPQTPRHTREALDGTRQQISEVLRGIRERINEVSNEPRPSTSLGAVLSSRLHTVASVAGARWTAAVHEVGERWPAHVEALIAGLVIAQMDRARVRGASRLDLFVRSGPDELTVTLAHDADVDAEDVSLARAAELRALGVQVVCRTEGDFRRLAIVGTRPAPEAAAAGIRSAS